MLLFYSQDERQQEFWASRVSTCFLQPQTPMTNIFSTRPTSRPHQQEVEPRQTHRSLTWPQNVFSNLTECLSCRPTHEAVDQLGALTCWLPCERFFFFFFGFMQKGGVSLSKRSKKPRLRLCSVCGVTGGGALTASRLSALLMINF